MKRLKSKTRIAALLIIIMVFSICNVFSMSEVKDNKIKVVKPKFTKMKKLTIKEGNTIDGLEPFSISSKKLSIKDAIKPSNYTEKINPLASEIITRADTNHDPNNALYIDVDAIYSDVLTEEGQSNWYYVYIPTAGKLTAFMQTLPDANIDYDLTIYTLNTSTSMLENPVYSQYGAAMDEQLSSVVQPGYYFICVNSYTGFDAANPYYFVVNYSQSYDSAEPDDNIVQAKQQAGSYFSLNQSIDNYYDMDWLTLTLNSTKTIFINFKDVSTSCTYKIDIFDSSLTGLGTLSQNASGSITLQAGTYYFRVRSENGFGSGYSLAVNQVSNTVSAVYDYSPDWRYILYSTPSGDLYCNDNKIASNTAVSAIYGRSSDWKYILYSTPSGELYTNDKKVTDAIKELHWYRGWQVNFTGGYTQRTQELHCGINKISGLGVYGSYTSTYTGSISNSFRIPVTNALYTYYYSTYQSGVNPYHYDSFYDVLGWRTPRYTDAEDEMYFGPMYLIINADTGAVIDFFNDLNYYYYKNLESANFTEK